MRNHGKVSIPLSYEAHDEGRLRATFELQNQAENNYYTVSIYNKVDSFTQFNVILTEDHFKLLHLDENTVELVQKGKPRIFEVIASS